LSDRRANERRAVNILKFSPMAWHAPPAYPRTTTHAVALSALIGTPNCVQWCKPFVVQVSWSHTHATKMARLGTPVSDTAGAKFVPVSPDPHPHAYSRTLSRVLTSLARQIACNCVNRLPCKCQACFTDRILPA